MEEVGTQGLGLLMVLSWVCGGGRGKRRKGEGGRGGGVVCTVQQLLWRVVNVQ